MKQALALVVLLLWAAPARADFLYKLVGYECDAKADAVVLTYTGALGEAGKRMTMQKGPRQWNPWSLVVKTKDGNSVLSEKTVRGQCRLSDGVYDIAIGPQPGNANLQGMCGGFVTAWAEVKRGAATVLSRRTFEFGDCHVAEPVTTRIVIAAGGKPPAVTKVPFEEFARDPVRDMPGAWRIAFVRDGSIWACDGDGTGQVLLIQNGHSPSWSPDRSRIAFARDGDVWVAAADGSGQQAVTSHWAGHASKDEAPSDVAISWHPAGGSLTFSHRETFTAERTVGAGSIAPGRHHVAGSIAGRSLFDIRLGGPQAGRAVVRYDVFDDGAGFAFGENAHPAWSPSGRKLSFTRNGDVWVAAATGGREGEPPADWWARRVAAVAAFDEPLRRASRDNRGATRLSWLPDERRLVYGYGRLQGSGFDEIHLLDTLSGRDSVVVREGLEPCVSPDGRFILYQAYGEACGRDGFCLCAVSLDGKTRLKLVPGGTQPVW